MSSVNKVLQKRRKAHASNTSEHSNQGESFASTTSNPNQAQSRQQKPIYDAERQKLFQTYSEYSQYNASSIQFSNAYIPCSLSLYNKYRMPMSCFLSPVNDTLEYTQRSAASIPRCSSCRAFMNYYNEATKKGFKCFLCGRDNTYDIDYSPDENHIERSSPNYLVDGPTGVYTQIPPQKVFIFLVDVSRDAWQCKMLSYIVAVLKDIFSREEMDQTQIYFYTFDQTVHQYSFSGEQVERTILDPSIKFAGSRNPDCFLSQIREKLLTFLDSLQDIAEKNTKQNSSFFSIFDYVYENIKHTGGKMFIFQSNDSIVGETFVQQHAKLPNNNNNNQQLKPKSFLQTKNKTFFNKFVQPMLLDNISMSLFVFGRTYKNIRVFSDTCKLTNSELFYYSKDTPQELNKFYYELFEMLGATYYVDTRIQFIISSGWYYTAVYGNLYRLKQFITFKFCHLQKSKRICAVFLPQEGFNPMPYFSLQIVTNYIYNRKHYLSVNTCVLPFTSSIQNLFSNVNHNISAATVFRTYLSTIRLEDIVSSRTKYVKHVASIWKAAHDYYKGEFTPEIRNMFLSFLAFLKNYHSQIELVNDTLIMERIISQRNILQSCNYTECITLFTPYLFDLTTIGNDRCLDDNFIYPDVCQLKFSSVTDGLFLMDTGFVLYLFIAKTYHPNYLLALFAKDKILKGETVNEEMIAEQNNQFSQQVLNLVRVLRESKSFGWVPLHIVRCGENSLNQKNFYLNFYQQKYDEYKSSKLSYDQFINMLSKQTY